MAVIIGAGVGLLTANAKACSVITHGFGQIGYYSARTMDFCVDMRSSFVVTPRGVAMSGKMKDENSLTWDSKYGYVTIEESQYGVTTEGVNEKGLAAHLLYNGETKQPERDRKTPGLGPMEWIHYVLGNYGSVEDAAADLNKYQIYMYPFPFQGDQIVLPLHFKIEDASGDNAIIEFIDGKINVWRGKEYAVMTNEPLYAEQLEFLKNVRKETPKYYNLTTLPGGAGSDNRFVRVNFINENLLSVSDTQMAVNYMFSAISGVYTPLTKGTLNCGFGATKSEPAPDTWATIWTTVADLSNKTIYYSNYELGNRVWLDLKKANLDKGQPVRTVNVFSRPTLSGDVTKLLEPVMIRGMAAH